MGSSPTALGAIRPKTANAIGLLPVKKSSVRLSEKALAGGPTWSNAQMIHPVKFDKPYLVMGYDWERCGREGDPPYKIQSDRQLAQRGLKIVSQVHQEYDAPFTLFVLGKMLEIPELCASLLEELESRHLRSIIDLQGHAYSHRPFKKSLHGNNPLGGEEIRHELMITRSLVREKLGYETIGLRTPLGYYRGLQGEDDTLRILAELGFAFVSSDLRNENDLFPSPWYDENGAFRQPYFYDQGKYPDLLEIPTQGWTDNALKGQSRTTKVEVHTLHQELDIHLKHLDFALENNLAYAPLCHPWAVATNDDDGFVIRGMLDYAVEKGIQVVSYKQLYEIVRGRCGERAQQRRRIEHGKADERRARKRFSARSGLPHFRVKGGSVLKRILSLLKRKRQPAVTAAAAGPFYTGWAMEAYPEMSTSEMRAIVRRQKEQGCNVVWIGHNNPGVVEQQKVEPGLSYAVYRAYTDSTHPRHDQAQAMVQAQHRLLTACRAEGMPVVFPVGYQIQMGENWEQVHPDDLTTDYNGQPLNISSHNASLFSSAYQTDIRTYYRWAYQQFVITYRDTIMMVNLSDEPQGADYSVQADGVFRQRHGYGMREAGADQERLQALGAFQSRYMVEYALWSANLWQVIAPDVRTTMSFCGHQARYAHFLPEIEPLFSDTPANFTVTFDAYPRDGVYTDPITDSDITSLFILARALGRYSARYNRPLWLWSTANSWGLGQASRDKADIADAAANALYLAQLVAQAGGHLEGIAFWNYNVKHQGLYNDTNPIVYNPDEMFHRVSGAGLWARAAMASGSEPVRVLIFAPAAHTYEIIGSTKTWRHVFSNYRFWDLNALARNDVNSDLTLHLTADKLEGIATVLLLAYSPHYLNDDELPLLRTFLAGGGTVVAKRPVADLLLSALPNPQTVTVTPYLTRITSSGGGVLYSSDHDVERIFSDTYRGELGGFWREVLGINKLHEGYVVASQNHVLLYNIAGRPVAFDVDVPFAYRGSRYHRNGSPAGELRGTSVLRTTLEHHEYAWLERAEEPPHQSFRGEYYDNISLSGSPAFTRDEATIDFDWGEGSPGAGLGADLFSVRWVGRWTFAQAGRYRFHTLTDDGGRLWVDGQLIIDDWHDHPATKRTGDILLSAGEHEIRMEYYENRGFALAKLWWELGPQVEGFRGEYFDNPHLSGVPAFVRDDAAIDFDWGEGSPGAGLAADRFSVRWTGRQSFEARTYRFHTLTDDGVRLWVDGQLIIDDWHDHPALERIADVTLTAGEHDIKMEYYENGGFAVAKLWWEVEPQVEGFRGEYFDNTDLMGPPAFTREEAAIDFDWGEGSPGAGLAADRFSVRWIGRQPFGAGTYRFHTLTDDGVRLWVDGQLVIDDWHDHPATHRSADVTLSAGQHEIKMEYYEKTGLALARLWWVPRDRVETFRGEYFNNPTLSGPPALVRDDEVIDFNWGTGSPAPGISSDQFSVRWTGKRTFEDGPYRFHALTDDGVRVWVDGRLIIDQWHDHPPTDYQAKVSLSAGQHDIKVEYYERGGGAIAKFWWGRAV